VEQAAAAAESMQEQAAMLAEAVSVFKLETGADTSMDRSVMQRTAAPQPGRRAIPASRLIAMRAAPAARPRHAALADGTSGTDEWEEF